MNTKKMTLTLSMLLALTQQSHAFDALSCYFSEPAAAAAAAAAAGTVGTAALALNIGKNTNRTRAELAALRAHVNGQIDATNRAIKTTEEKMRDMAGSITGLEKAVFGNLQDPAAATPLRQEITYLKDQIRGLQGAVGNVGNTNLAAEINILIRRVTALEKRLALDAQEDRADQSLRAQVVITAGQIALVDTAAKEQAKALRSEFQNTHASLNGTLQGLSELVKREVGAIKKGMAALGGQLDGLAQEQQKTSAETRTALADLRARMDQSNAHFEGHINRHATELARLSALNPAADGGNGDDA